MPGTINSYKDLQVWQKARVLVKEVYLLTKGFPDDEKFGLTLQLKRAIISVPSNIAEGWGRGTRKQFINALTISRGSLLEVETQLILAQDLKLLKDFKIADGLINELSKMLNSLISKLQLKDKIKK